MAEGKRNMQLDIAISRERGYVGKDELPWSAIPKWSSDANRAVTLFKELNRRDDIHSPAITWDGEWQVSWETGNVSAYTLPKVIAYAWLAVHLAAKDSSFCWMVFSDAEISYPEK